MQGAAADDRTQVPAAGGNERSIGSLPTLVGDLQGEVGKGARGHHGSRPRRRTSLLRLPPPVPCPLAGLGRISWRALSLVPAQSCGDADCCDTPVRPSASVFSARTPLAPACSNPAMVFTNGSSASSPALSVRVLRGVTCKTRIRREAAREQRGNPVNVSTHLTAPMPVTPPCARPGEGGEASAFIHVPPPASARAEWGRLGTSLPAPTPALLWGGRAVRAPDASLA
jgi:hypothetical protein